MFEQINDEAMMDSQIFLKTYLKEDFFPRNPLMLVNDFSNQIRYEITKYH